MRKHLKTEHTRKLPHFHRVGATFFITVHLYGSVPFDLLKKLQDKRDQQVEKIKKENPPDKDQQIYLIRRAYFYEYDDLLDACQNSPTHLVNPKVATIVENEFRKYDGRYYNLVSLTLMPNHFHVVLDFALQVHKMNPFILGNYTNVSKVMGLIKGSSSFKANQIIGNTGNPFWGAGYYDRYIRNHFHYLAAVNYTINNVVKAKICNHWMEHPFTLLHPDYRKFDLIFPNQ